jgi:3-hydroxyacyl-[acyl-carrier-protein] dehydratase
MSDSKPAVAFDIQKIIKHQRNRYPVLLVDRLLSVDPGKSVRGLKCFTYNEWFFPGHFDDEPNVPGFVQVECLAQTFIMTFLCMDEYKGMKTNFISINNTKFKKKITPGDVLITDASLVSFKRGLATGSASGTVDGELACSADFIISVPDILEKFRPVSGS